MQIHIYMIVTVNIWMIQEDEKNLHMNISPSLMKGLHKINQGSFLSRVTTVT